MTELPLDLILAGIGGRGETHAQRVARKSLLSVSFGEIPTHAGGKRGAFDKAHDVIIVEAVGAGLLAVLCHPVEQRPVRDRLRQVCSARIGLM